MISLPTLPFQPMDLEPYISAETIKYHYDHHHKEYINTINDWIKNNPKYDNVSIKQLIELIPIDSPIHPALHQAHNHTMFWSTLTSASTSAHASRELTNSITKCFGGWMKFKRTVQHRGMEFTGSGWMWVVVRGDTIEIITTQNQNAPDLTSSDSLLFVIDLWEHSYYLDSPANKQKYLSNIWYILNWNVINDRFNNHTNQA